MEKNISLVFPAFFIPVSFVTLTSKAIALCVFYVFKSFYPDACFLFYRGLTLLLFNFYLLLFPSFLKCLFGIFFVPSLSLFFISFLSFASICHSPESNSAVSSIFSFFLQKFFSSLKLQNQVRKKNHRRPFAVVCLLKAFKNIFRLDSDVQESNQTFKLFDWS
jgi:hypothetical protein